MDKALLLQTAGQLTQVQEKTASEYSRKMDQLVAQMNAKILVRKDIKELVGENNLDMMKDNHANHARFMNSMFMHYNPEVIVETVLWVFRAYRSHGFTTNYWAAQLNIWIELMKNELSKEAYAEIFPYYQWMQINIPLFVKLSDDKLTAPNSLH
jgi:hypothetical protein